MGPVEDQRHERLCAAVLILAGAASATLLLWLNRSTSFFIDEILWFSDLGGDNDPSSIVHPHNSHLIGTTRLLYLAVNELVGPDYLIFRIVGVLSVLLCAGLFYAWAKRRIGPVWSLLPAILLLFLGSAWQHVVVPIGFTVTFSIAAGLAALLALERDDRKGDILACAFVCLSVFTYTVGLGYLVGVGIMVLLRQDRLRRAWIFLVPLLLYAGWWFWAQQFDQGRVEASNLLHVGKFFADSIAIDAGAITGVNIPWSRFGSVDSVTQAPASPLGWLVALLILVVVIWRIIRGNVPRSLYASIGILATYWLAAALADFPSASAVTAVRYVYPSSIGLLLVLVAAAQGARFRGLPAVVVVTVFLFSLAMNLVFLRDGAAFMRQLSVTSRTDLAMLELGNGLLPGEGRAAPGGEVQSPGEPSIPHLDTALDQVEYIAAVKRYGSPSFDLEQIRALPATDRAVADVALQQTDFDLLLPTEAPTDRQDCVTALGSGGAFALPAGGAYLRPAGPEAAPVPLALSRFGDPPGFPLGDLPADGWTSFAIPLDAAPDPWKVTVPPSARIKVCPLD